MGIFWEGTKHVKSDVTLFILLNPIGPYLGISNEILCILVAQGATTGGQS